MNGVIVIDKEKNYTSRDVVNIASKSLKTNKLGHTGTLDPLATGVLVLCVNDATKIVELLTSDDKEYIAEATLGIETDTLDITGEVLGFSSCIIEKERIEEAISKFKGEYMQEVPLYSAVRIDGKRLYDYAFDNQKIKLPSRKVNIKEIELLSETKTEEFVINGAYDLEIPGVGFVHITGSNVKILVHVYHKINLRLVKTFIC